jgi:GTPase SAR1 family protein
VLVVGLPGSGKSSLLGAFAQVARTRPDQLGFDRVGVPPALEELRDHVYAGKDGPAVTRSEVVKHHVRLDPAGPPEVLLCDCSGKMAGDLIERPDTVARRRNRGELIATLREADALILTINSAATEKEIDTTFKEFARFLESLEEARTFQREVGGLPVYLVLTQCDRLKETGDNTARWQAHIDARRKQLADRFHDYLIEDQPDDNEDSPYLAFGSVELDARTTAVRRPPLTDDPGDPQGPFGVGDLFRDCLAAAGEHRTRVLTARRRLRA